MPPLLAALFVLFGLGAGSSALGPPRAWEGRDPTARPRLGRPERGFHTSLSSAPHQYARRGADGREVCRASVFGTSLGRRVVRFQADGVERELGWSWGVDVEARPGQRRVVVTRYLDPVGGAELACREVSFLCVPETGWAGEVQVVRPAPPCREDAGPGAGVDQTGGPRLEFPRPSPVLGRYVPGYSAMVGTVTLVAELRGRVDELWYCPRVEWELPLEPGPRPQLTSRSSAEGDCDPWAPGARAERRFVRRVSLPEGTWTVTVRLWKGDRMLAQRSQTVTVGTTGGDPWQRGVEP